ncbi:MAG: hypothetical protein HYU47_05300 [Deltaproteobacteria bacterium]|nr:hypothetical protein [Deltaproteobacteria bacterium]
MQNGASAEKVEAVLGDYRKNPLFSPRERLALELAERMTYTKKRVTDRFFKRVKRQIQSGLRRGGERLLRAPRRTGRISRRRRALPLSEAREGSDGEACP